MDSRIREIEQWIAEAKSDLGECGREAYLRKLYLLDAEIKAVLKENHGILPEAVSPRHRGKRVRRFATPGLALTGAIAGALLLTASTVYLTPLLASHQSAPALRLTASRATPAFDYIPAQLPTGEVLVTADWRPPVDSSNPLLLADATQLAVDEAASRLPVLPSKPVSAMPAGQPAAPRPAYSGRSEATPVVILAGLPASGAKPVNKQRRAAPAASSFGAGEVLIAREVSYPSEAEFREDFSVNHTKETTTRAKRSSDGKLPAEVILTDSVDNVDNDVSTGDADVDKLDPDALKETLEKPFNR